MRVMFQHVAVLQRSGKVYMGSMQGLHGGHAGSSGGQVGVMQGQVGVRWGSCRGHAVLLQAIVEAVCDLLG